MTVEYTETSRCDQMSSRSDRDLRDNGCWMCFYPPLVLFHSASEEQPVIVPASFLVRAVLDLALCNCWSEQSGLGVSHLCVRRSHCRSLGAYSGFGVLVRRRRVCSSSRARPSADRARISSFSAVSNGRRRAFMHLCGLLWTSSNNGICYYHFYLCLKYWHQNWATPHSFCLQ